MIYLLTLLKQFLLSVKEGNPFINKNVLRFRIFGFVIIGASIIADVLSTLPGFFLKNTLQLPENIRIVNNLDLSWEMIFLGIIFLVIAEVFKIGTVVKEENDYTI